MADEDADLKFDNFWSSDDKDDATQYPAVDTHTTKSAYHTTTPAPFANPFVDDLTGTDIDPLGENFSIDAWFANFVSFRSSSSHHYIPRTLGLCFNRIRVYGTESRENYQKSVGNYLLGVASLVQYIAKINKRDIKILNDFSGLVNPGELLLVLGRPGSGCSTFLKTIAGDTYGLIVDGESKINYQGITPKQLAQHFRGEAVYTAENDTHFPQQTVGDTLLFASKARAPRDHTYPGGVTRDIYARHLTQVMLAAFGLRHTRDTNVGNDFVKGVSGGERKRVSIAEAVLSGSCLQCWDNSTRGLDSSNALAFCKILRLSAKALATTACVSLYQGPQQIYDLFDKVTVLYEGRQIYFGPCASAKEYFQKIGFEPAPRQNIPDFLTSLTNSDERDRLIRAGYERLVPRTCEEFELKWQASAEFAKLVQEIEEYNRKYTFNGNSLQHFKESRRSQQATRQEVTSPYTLSLYQQVSICVTRGFQLMRRDASVTISRVVSNSLMAFVISSIFYNLQANTNDALSISILIFFACLFNAFASSLEILFLFAQRPIVEKHSRYAFYRPVADAIASFICDLPYKIYNSIFFNIILYFLTNLRRTPAAFFTFWLFMFMTTCTISMFYRTVGATSRTLAQALTPAALLNLAFMLYTGFAVPVPEMVVWFRWINYLNPIAYSFQALMINEYQGRTYQCSGYVPSGSSYMHVGSINQVCSAVGASPGSGIVTGNDYLRLNFDYYPEQLWRNLGILCIFFLFFTFTHLVAIEMIAGQRSKGEFLLFRRDQQKQIRKPHIDVESGALSNRTQEAHSEKVIPRSIHAQTSMVQWRDVCLDVNVKKKGNKAILQNVDGYIKPGTLTALMGPSGAGKTTLLDVLATRTSIGTLSGEVLVDGRQRDDSFQRKTGYVQQLDIHLETSTVREALRYSALLRQPAQISMEDKLRYIEEVIKLLSMEEYADAVVCAPGEGLNLEQRKTLTIAIELVSRPQLLLFLDEPTSGLDSQTAWSIVKLLEMLNSHGQAILCTIHQPSATLFQKFHRLLFLGPCGRPVYFGDIGTDCSTMIRYFERHGATSCPQEANPAEWMMEIVGCVPGSHSEIDWPTVWRQSAEYVELHKEMDLMRVTLPQTANSSSIEDKREYEEFAAPFTVQLWECFKRANSHHWYSPGYIYSKISLCLCTGLFLGFSLFQSSNSIQNLENQVFGIFLLIASTAGTFVPQILPSFVAQRSIFEARERPAKVYSWRVFMLANIMVELPWNTLMAVIVFVTWYYPVGLYKNAQPTGEVATRSGLAFLLVWIFFMHISTVAQFVMAGLELAELAGNLANTMSLFSLMFCGILATPTAMPGFWVWMWRVNPYTYLVDALLSVTLANAPITCSEVELLHFQPPPNLTCGEYMKPYISTAGGYLVDPGAHAATGCAFCPLNSTNAFLDSVQVSYERRWMNFGILWVFIVVNVVGAMGLYWLARVPRKRKLEK